MIKLTANDWFTVTGRGLVASVDVSAVEGVPRPMRGESDLPVRHGDHVLIDGQEYRIRGVEYARALVSPPYIKPDICLLVTAVTKDAGQ